MTIIKCDNEEGKTDPKSKISAEMIEKTKVHKNHKKKISLKENTLIHRLIESRSCCLHDDGNVKTRIKKKCSKFDMPYVPSIKSLPHTSFSEATLISNLKNKSQNKPIRKCVKKKLLKETENKEDIIAQTNMLSSEENYKNKINNIIKSITSADTNYDSEESGIQMIPDNLSYVSNETGIKSAKPLFKKNWKKVQCKQVSNHNKEIQTKEQDDEFKINELTTKRHRKRDCQRNKIKRNFCNDSCRSYNKSTTLLLYDCNKYPLTDSRGQILKTADGKHLIKYKNGKPNDCFGRSVFDLNGHSSSSQHFRPFLNAIKNKNIISAVPLYDFRGYCLLNYDGSSLINANGNDLVQLDENGKIMCDINHHPIFDQNGIPITQENGQWLLPSGVPLRIFDETKHPLTNKRGETLCDVHQRELLKRDKHGRPLLDSNDKFVFDASGSSAGDPKFNPSTIPNNLEITLIAIIDSEIAPIYDARGWPLTEKNGEVMCDSEGRCLLMLNSNNTEGRNEMSLHLNKPIPLNEINLFNEYNTKSKNHGETLNQRKILLGYFGYPLCDRSKGNVFDKDGKQIFLNITGEDSSIKTVIPDDAFTTNPMTPSQTKILLKDNLVFPKTVSFITETDLFGRPVYDSSNCPLYDKYGRPMYDLFGRPLYNCEGFPIATSDGVRLDNGLDESPGAELIFHTSYLVPQDPNNLPNIKDLNGGPVFDSSGFPFYNQKGKPLIDAYGRPLYDEHGYPLCDEKGRPASKLVKQKQIPISFVEDKIEMLKLSTKDIFNTQDGKVYQPEIVQRDNNYKDKNEETPNFEGIKTFLALMRTTVFSNGETYYEILEFAPCMNPEKLI